MYRQVVFCLLQTIECLQKDRFVVGCKSPNRRQSTVQFHTCPLHTPRIKGATASLDGRGRLKNILQTFSTVDRTRLNYLALFFSVLIEDI